MSAHHRPTDPPLLHLFQRRSNRRRKLGVHRSLVGGVRLFRSGRARLVLLRLCGRRLQSPDLSLELGHSELEALRAALQLLPREPSLPVGVAQGVADVAFEGGELGLG